jgi:hypothetical protein
MATITYSSFHRPRIADESPSSSSLPHDQLPQLSLMDASIPIDLNNIVGISDTAIEDENYGTEMTRLDSARYDLAHTTPTKERTRRATMPDSMKCRSHEVLPHPCHIRHLKNIFSSYTPLHSIDSFYDFAISECRSN